MNTFNYFFVHLNDPALAPGTFRYQDLPMPYGCFIEAFVPGATYAISPDDHTGGEMTLVLSTFIKTPMNIGVAPNTHGTLDAILPYEKGRNDMGVPGSTCALHVVF